ncbi:induced myeloid leukemia cell differentiation protein Mcl-1 homolog [Erpetoichthys calabaricus]|uniref:Induced myeloid leukemia cell differentiation protein Mcl-1 homolog n=1 Tax=Erpetoichthys calabaricus TaxID=27687 RepID=A0A8C4SVH9_ERPCA|nr:induced myeloid leukemia cell differentiation protein Mcl-1 homolog [Erpetoichthys calabaricus]
MSYFSKSTQTMSRRLEDGKFDDNLEEADSVSQLQKLSSKNCLELGEGANVDSCRPSTRDATSRPVDSVQCGPRPVPRLEKETRELIAAYLFRSAGLPHSCSRSGRKPYDILVLAGDRIIENNKSWFNELLESIDVSQKELPEYVTTLAQVTLTGREMKWRYVLGFIIHGSVVAKRLKQVNQEHCILPLADLMSALLLKHCKDWIVKNRAWEGFSDYYHFLVREPETWQFPLTCLGLSFLAALLVCLFEELM